MFRGLVLGALLLAGCTAKTSTPPRIVKVFEGVTPERASLWDECEWKTLTLSVFDQKAQTISFESQKCTNDFAAFYVKNGHDIFVPVKLDHQGVNVVDEDFLLLSIWKTGPHSDEEFIKTLIPQTEEAGASCQPIKGEDNNWRIGLTEAGQKKGFAGSWTMYPPLSGEKYEDSSGICGPYSYNGGTMFNIGISNGIAIGYSEELRRFGYFELASITYENKG